MFIENKYKTWHDNIIAKGKNRVLDCYKEKYPEGTAYSKFP